jgi:hypothetical protein
MSSTISLPILGGCLCGSVRYEITAEPVITRACWCRLCQYIGAGSGTINACFPSAAVTIRGELSKHSSIADSGNVMHRRFCPACGTPLFSEAEVRPHLMFVRAGSLDNPELVQPSVTIWTSKAPSWACINATLPNVPLQPLPPTTTHQAK